MGVFKKPAREAPILWIGVCGNFVDTDNIRSVVFFAMNAPSRGAPKIWLITDQTKQTLTIVKTVIFDNIVPSKPFCIIALANFVHAK